MDVEELGRWVESGRIVDFILVVIACEAAALVVYHRFTGGGLGAREVLPNLASGAFLLLALRFALARAPWPTLVCAVCAALAAHAYDLSRRWAAKRALPSVARDN